MAYMAGIDVLSESLKTGSKMGRTSASKDKTNAESARKAAVTFAAVLNGKIKPTADSKGQSSTAGQVSQEKKSGENPVPNSQNTNGQAITLDYSSFAFPLLNQLVQQSDFPGGKEANSGDNNENQGSEKSALISAASGLASKNSELAVVINLLTQVSDKISTQLGMMTGKFQEKNSTVSELDNYKQAITDLLEKLSGEITDVSAKGSSLSSESANQEIAKIIQGWLMSSDNGAQNALTSNLQKEIQASSVPNQMLSAGNEESNPKAFLAKAGKLVAELDKAALNISNTLLSQGDEVPKDLAAPAKVKGLLSQELVKEEGAKSDEPIQGKGAPTQNSSLDIGLANNISAANDSDGKISVAPVWQQISTEIREQLSNKSQDLKQLDIQLHPAELGKIQIDLRWENGQVHLQVQASQAATGQLLQEQLSDLRQALVNQGINCGMLQMGMGGEQQKPNGDKSGKSHKYKTNSDEDEDQLPVINSLSLDEDGINQINVTA
jgi:flagellar hook-length control protein FliK